MFLPGTRAFPVGNSYAYTALSTSHCGECVFASIEKKRL